MNRKDFLLKLGVGAAVTACAVCLDACKQQDSVPTPPSGVDFSLDISDPANNGINGSGLVKNGIIIVKTSSNTYVAVSAACTHQGTIIEYDRVNNRFFCSAHGSQFATDGSVLHDPATRALTRYNTTLTGTTLRVFS